MKNLVTKYFALTVALLLAGVVIFAGTFPADSLAKLNIEESGGGDVGGDPNDEQDFSSGSGGGYYDDDYEDEYWGAPSDYYELPFDIYDIELVLLLPIWDSSVPVIRIYIISPNRSSLGEFNVR